MKRENNLQPDDMRLIKLLGGTFLFLHEKQIFELFPDRSAGWFRRRLKKLVQDGWLDVRELGDEWTLPHYHLGRRGQNVLDPDSKNPKIQGRLTQARKFGDSELPHLQFSNWIHIKFGMASRDYDDYELVSWIPQYARLWNVLDSHGLSVQPDGYAHYRKSGREFHAFIEADRVRYRGEPMRRKLQGYWRYAVSERAEEHFSARGFRVLFVTEGQRRAKELLKATLTYPPQLFWVSARGEFQSNPLFHAHWKEHSSPVPHSLDEPTEDLPEPPMPTASRL